MTKKKLVIISVTGLVLIGIIAGLWWYMANKPKRQDSPKPGDLSYVNRKEVVDLRKKEDTITDESSYQSTAKAYENTIKNANTADQADLYLRKAVVAMKTQHYDDAIDAAKKAAEASPSPAAYSLMGDAAAAKNDKQAAIDYYKQSISALDKKSPYYSKNVTEIEKKITTLGGAK